MSPHPGPSPDQEHVARSGDVVGPLQYHVGVKPTRVTGMPDNSAINIEDLRRRARRRLPRALFDFVDGGGEDEWSVRENRAAFERLTFRPRVLVDVSQRDQ